MSVPQAEVYEAFRGLALPDDEAPRATVALSAAMTKVDNETTDNIKRDVDIEAIREGIPAINGTAAEIDKRMALMQGEINLLRWMTGTTIALLVTVLFRVFTR